MNGGEVMEWVSIVKLAIICATICFCVWIWEKN